MKTNCSRWIFSGSLLALFLLLPGAARTQAQDACHGALISSESGASLGSATGCGVIITVTAVDDSGNATAFTISVPGNGNPYDSPPFAMEGDSSDDTLVGIINNSTGSLSAITLTSANTTFGGAFNFGSDGPCDFAAFHELGRPSDCPSEGSLGETGYEGPDSSFGTCDGPCPTTRTVFFTTPLEQRASTWFALEGTPSSLTLVQQAILTFNPSTTPTSAIATFGCSTNASPCLDPGAHSMKFTVNSVSQTFSITLLAVEVDGDGICESGDPNDASDPIDCRFVTFFGEPGGTPANPNAVNVPLCYAYSSAPPNQHCVFYSVQGAPPPPGQPNSPYTGPVLEAIAWNTLETPPAGFVNSPRMYDDPSDDHTPGYYPVIPGFPYPLTKPDDNQFVFDITTFFNPSPGTVGTDPTTGGKTKTFNDFVIAFPLTIAQVQQPVNSDGSSVFNAQRGVVPIKFNLLKDGVATCNLPAATLSLTRLFGGTPGSVDESMYAMAADSGSNFRVSGCQYIYNLAASAVGAGQYKVGLQIGNEIVGIAYFELK
jgi:hypothetical protein